MESFASREEIASPHISPGTYCNAGSARVYCGALGRPPQRTVRYAYVALPSRALYPRASPTFRDDTW